MNKEVINGSSGFFYNRYSYDNRRDLECFLGSYLV